MYMLGSQQQHHHHHGDKVDVWYFDMNLDAPVLPQEGKDRPCLPLCHGYHTSSSLVISGTSGNRAI
jgi:hypothetical protein